MAFDIEADSSHGDFPIATKDYLKLAQDLITLYEINRNHELLNDVNIEKTLTNLLKLAFNDNYHNVSFGENKEESLNLIISKLEKRNLKYDRNFLVAMANDKYNDNFNINRVYTKGNMKPKESQIKNLMYKLC